MVMTATLRQGVDRIRDYLYGGGYPNPAINAEQLSFLMYFYMYEAADEARVRVSSRPGSIRYQSAFAGDWELQNSKNARKPGEKCVSRSALRWSTWANALSGIQLVTWVRDEVFPFYICIADDNAENFMNGARLLIDEPTVLSQVISQINDLHLEQVDADTKGDLFEHVLRQIRMAGELGQYRTPRHIIRHLVNMIDPKMGETIYDPAVGTAGFLVAAYDHIRLKNSSEDGVEVVKIDGMQITRGLGDLLTQREVERLQQHTLYGTDVDSQFVRLGKMNLSLRGLEKVRLLRMNVLTNSMDSSVRSECNLPHDGFDVVLANPPFSGRLDKDRIVEEVRIGNTSQTSLLFLKYIMNQLKYGGRCGIVVPDGLLFGTTGVHQNLRKNLIENNSVVAVVSLPSGVFKPYSGVKTSLLIFRKGGVTSNVLFLHVDNDGYKLDSNHEKVIEENDLPQILNTYKRIDAALYDWESRNEEEEWTKNWWFATRDKIAAQNYMLAANTYRPTNSIMEEFRDVREVFEDIISNEMLLWRELKKLSTDLKVELKL